MIAKIYLYQNDSYLMAIYLRLNDELERVLRQTVGKRKGTKKGVIEDAAKEAFIEWIIREKRLFYVVSECPACKAKMFYEKNEWRVVCPQCGNSYWITKT